MTDAGWRPAVTTPDRVAQDFPDILHELADLKWAVVVVRGFYALEDCREVVARIERDREGLVTIKEYRTADGEKLQFRYIGPGLGQYAKDREGFFRESRLADAKFERLYDGLPDPRKMVRETIGRLLPGRQVIVAHEDGVHYGDAVIRNMMEGDPSALHRDSAMTYFKGWMVSQFPTQFSSLVCFQMPESGGELSVFKQRWTPEDDARKPMGATRVRQVGGRRCGGVHFQARGGRPVHLPPRDIPRHRTRGRPARSDQPGHLHRHLPH